MQKSNNTYGTGEAEEFTLRGSYRGVFVGSTLEIVYLTLTVGGPIRVGEFVLTYA